MELRRDSIRAFVAAYPTTAALAKILDFREEIREQMPRKGVRWVSEQQLHLTLRFIDALPEDRVVPLIEDLCAAAEQSPLLNLKASYIGPLWDRCKVLGLHLEGSQELVVMQKKIEEAVSRQGIAKDVKGFKAHLTLARLEDHRLLPRLEPEIVCEWALTEIFVVKSELQAGGAKHTPLARIPLGKGVMGIDE